MPLPPAKPAPGSFCDGVSLREREPKDGGLPQSPVCALVPVAASRLFRLQNLPPGSFCDGVSLKEGAIFASLAEGGGIRRLTQAG